jgi:hypothetical protein
MPGETLRGLIDELKREQRSFTLKNLASRLADEATAGQILITQRLYAEVEDDIEVEPVGEFTLKGFQRPVAAFNVVAVRDTAAAELSQVSGQGTDGG